MKRSPRFAGTPSKLSESVRRQLNGYALAVGAAGAGILALSRPAEAKIVYTPANIHTLGNAILDLNFDQQANLVLLASGDVSTNGHGTSSLQAATKGRNRVEGPAGLASALSSGAVVGPKQSFFGNLKLLERCRWADVPVCSGKWYSSFSKPHYLGLKVYIRDHPEQAHRRRQGARHR
jgi:hypothetical protein